MKPYPEKNHLNCEIVAFHYCREQLLSPDANDYLPFLCAVCQLLQQRRWDVKEKLNGCKLQSSSGQRFSNLYVPFLGKWL